MESVNSIVCEFLTGYEVQDRLRDLKVSKAQSLLTRQKSDQTLGVKALKSRVAIQKKTSRESKSEKVVRVIFKRPSLETVWENLSERDLNSSWESKAKIKVLLKEGKIDEVRSLLPNLIAEDCLRWARESVAESLCDKVRVLSEEDRLGEAKRLLSDIREMEAPTVLSKAKRIIVRALSRGLYREVKSLLKEGNLDEAKKLLPDLREIGELDFLRKAEEIVVAAGLYEKVQRLVKEDELDEAKRLLPGIPEGGYREKAVDCIDKAASEMNFLLKALGDHEAKSLPSDVLDSSCLTVDERRIANKRALFIKKEHAEPNIPNEKRKASKKPSVKIQNSMSQSKSQQNVSKKVSDEEQASLEKQKSFSKEICDQVMVFLEKGDFDAAKSILSDIQDPSYLFMARQRISDAENSQWSIPGKKKSK